MSALFISFVAFLIINPILCDQQSAQQQQRNSIGFLGTRGKRSSSEISKSTTTLGNSISDESLEQSVTPLDDSKVNLSGFKEYSGQEIMLDPWPMYRQLRAPNGFFGVRGKKEYDDQVNSWRAEVKKTFLFNFNNELKSCQFWFAFEYLLEFNYPWELLSFLIVQV